MPPLAVLALALALVPAPASPSGATTVPAPAATLPPATDGVDTRALRWMRAMQRGTIDRRELSPAMAEAVPQPIVDLVAAEYGPMGAPTGFTFERTERVRGGTARVYHVTFVAEDATWVFATDAAGRIIGFHFYPAEAPTGAPPS